MRVFVMLAALVLLVTPALADHHEGGGDQMAAMPEMGKPAEMDNVAFMLGDWDVTMKFKMDPSMPDWMETTGTASVEPVLNGCANRMVFESNIMGMPFKGMDHTTYNREYDRYESVWIDDMAGKMTLMHGNFEGDKLVLTGDDKMQGMEFKNRSTATKVSDDEVYWTMEMSMDGGKTWVENMQMTYTRKK